MNARRNAGILKVRQEVTPMVEFRFCNRAVSHSVGFYYAFMRMFYLLLKSFAFIMELENSLIGRKMCHGQTVHYDP